MNNIGFEILYTIRLNELLTITYRQFGKAIHTFDLRFIYRSLGIQFSRELVMANVITLW